MNEPELKSLAFLLAERTPEHLAHPTIPPIHWNLEEGEILRVLLADGREIRAPLESLKSKPVKKQTVIVPSIAALPVHPTVKKSGRTK